jgi:hypothetical protein
VAAALPVRLPPVAVSDDGKDAEPVADLIRMPALPIPEVPAVAKDKPEDVAGDALEPPPVADAVEEAARDLASRIWFNGWKPRARLTVDDEVLAYAVEQTWLEIRGPLVVRGQINPTPQEEPVSSREQRLRWGPGWD